jgi:hypothetical protein
MCPNVSGIICQNHNLDSNFGEYHKSHRVLKCSLLILKLFIADTNAQDEVCEHGILFKKDCNFCHCSADGQSYACTEMACPPKRPKPLSKQSKSFSALTFVMIFVSLKCDLHHDFLSFFHRPPGFFNILCPRLIDEMNVIFALLQIIRL